MLFRYPFYYYDMSGGYQPEPQPSTSNGIHRAPTDTPLSSQEMFELSKILDTSESKMNAAAAGAVK